MSSFNDKFILSICAVSIVSLPVTLIRIENNGLLNLFGLHLFLILVALLLTVFRKALSFKIKSIIIGLLCTTVSVSSLYTFGFVAAGLPWMFITLSYVFLVHPALLTRAIVLAITILLLIALGFISGKLVSPIDPNVMLAQASFWFGLSVPAIAFMVLLLLQIKTHQKRLKRQQRDLINENETLKHSANYDHLTNTLNRRGFEQVTEALFNETENHDVSVIAIDVDFFKSINDKYGHDAGDVVLRKFAAMIKSHLHSDDVLCRYGGEEFILLLKNRDEQFTITLCERLREASQGLSIVYAEHNIRFTASFGVVLADNRESIHELICRADSALYRAKEAGRNLVVLFNQ